MEWSYYFILILFIMLIAAIIYISQLKLQQNEIKSTSNRTKRQNQKVENELSKLQKENEYLTKVMFADENIFDYIRCINIPQTPACKAVNGWTKDRDSSLSGKGIPAADQIGPPDSSEKNKSNICRSRFIDCNKYKLFLENDPIARERVLVATNRWSEADKPKNPSELTYPIRSWWLF